MVMSSDVRPRLESLLARGQPTMASEQTRARHPRERLRIVSLAQLNG